MPARRVQVVPPDALADGLRVLRAQAGLPEAFPAEAQAEAEAAAAGRATHAAALAARAAPRVDRPFVTVDPPGSRDLDQALCIERLGDGHRVRYAIADVGAHVAPGGALDAEAHRRAVTVYLPDGKVPLHPPVLSEGAASLLPGQWTASVLWTVDLDARGRPVATSVERATVRSAAQHTYADLPADVAGVLREVGERRAALERERGGVRLDVPEQEVVRGADGAWTTAYRAPLPVEEHNAQVSLLVGLEAARLMLAARVGILRTQPAPRDRDLERLRRTAAALQVPWPAEEPYPELVRRLRPSRPAEAALARAATGVAHGAGYTAFDGAPPADPGHFAVAAPYAHATAPLRRLQDRFVSECCLHAANGTPLPDWVRTGLGDLPRAMADGARRANGVERQVLDLAEAVLLHGREGETFAGVTIDEDTVQIADPAVRAPLHAEDPPAPGTTVAVRLGSADPARRAVFFELA